MARTTFTADELLDAFRVWDVPVREYPGWRTRGRPGGIAAGGWRGILQHHTGSNSQSKDYLAFLFERGRPEDKIPAPLCNASLGADGVLNLGALGRANHAGEGSSVTLAKISNDAAPSNGEMTPGRDNINGNPYYWGFEWMYDGKTPPPLAMYELALRATAAIIWLMRRITGDASWGAGRTGAHREHTKRKTDPGKVLMGKFRTDLAAVLAAGPPLGDDDMAGAVDEIKAALNAGFADLKKDIYAGPRYEALQSELSEIDAEGDNRYVRAQQVVDQQKAEADTRQQALLDAIDNLGDRIVAALGGTAKAAAEQAPMPE